jgi:hypothetical protein
MLQSRGLHNLTTTSMTWQHCRQHDLVLTSHHGQVAPTMSSPVWLSSIVVNMTRQIHRVAAKLPQQRRRRHASVALMQAWLDVYIMLQPSRLASIVVSMTRHHCRQHDSASTSRCGQVTSAVPSRAWLGIIVTSMTQHLHRATAKSPRQCHTRFLF